MTQIVIQVTDTTKAQLLSELLRAMDFVTQVDVQVDNSETTAVTPPTTTIDETADFSALFGIWAERDIDIDTIRQNAWPRQTSA